MKIIRSSEEYDSALVRIEELVDLDPEPETDLADELDLLVLLVNKYEEEKYPIEAPDAIEAIKFRMEQQGLSQKDLVPFIGSRSKVSEVLSGKRELTLSMIRALNKHLGIPAEVLLKEKALSALDKYGGIEFNKFPIAGMVKNKAFTEVDTSNFMDKSEELIGFLIDKIGGCETIPEGLFRKSKSTRLNAKIGPFALQGWSLQVLAQAADRKTPVKFDRKNMDKSFFRSLTSLSVLDEGPKLAREFLIKNGIILEIVPHLKNTYIDGASFIDAKNRAIIGLTIRYDRIDNFWFTLLHELAHIILHLEPGGFFADDMSLRGSESDDEIEKQADAFAEEALLPDDFPLSSRQFVSKEDILQYASAHNIHPAIAAGRIQHDRNDFRTFSNLVGRGEVKKIFGLG